MPSGRFFIFAIAFAAGLAFLISWLYPYVKDFFTRYGEKITQTERALDARRDAEKRSTSRKK
jgi:hypothetical protein